MKTEKNILAAFILNLCFSIFEFLGGILTGSVAIMSDSVHDIGDAASIGVSYFLEKKSKRQPDSRYTYGYARYSVLGGAITTFILLIGSVIMIASAVQKIINPTEINSGGMIIFAIIGVVVNFFAAYFTHGGDSVNQKAVNLHMLEDVLGWAVVLVGAIVIKITDFTLIDPIMSIFVATFILANALKNLRSITDIFLEKTPHGFLPEQIKETVCEVEGVLDAHHIHLRSLDGHSVYATMHVVANGDAHDIKQRVKNKLGECGVHHSTLELETADEHCHDIDCHTEHSHQHGCHHHH